MKSRVFFILLSLTLAAPGLAGEKYTTARPSPPDKPFGQQERKTASITITQVSEPAEVRVGNPARGFILPDVNGIYHRLRDYQGKPVVMFFFRADCQPCQTVMDKLIEFHRIYKEDVDVLAVALLEEPDGRAKLDEYLESVRPRFPVLVDAEEEVADVYFTPGDLITLPGLFFIDQDMIVIKKMHRVNRPLIDYLND